MNDRIGPARDIKKTNTRYSYEGKEVGERYDHLLPDSTQYIKDQI